MTTLSVSPHGQEMPPFVGAALEHALGQAGFDACRSGGSILLPSGLRLTAVLSESRALEEGVVAMAVRIAALHEAALPHGLVEVLHVAGADAGQALAQGFSAWVQGVLPVLEDAVRAGVGAGVQECALLAIRFPGEDSAYQAILGPILHLGPDAAQYTEDEESCPACMTTRLQDLLRNRLADSCTGLTLVAGRNAEGGCVADCRMNGEAFAEGAARLLAYAQAWPGSGIEIRSQYVIVRPLR